MLRQRASEKLTVDRLLARTPHCDSYTSSGHGTAADKFHISVSRRRIGPSALGTQHRPKTPSFSSYEAPQAVESAALDPAPLINHMHGKLPRVQARHPRGACAGRKPRFSGIPFTTQVFQFDRLQVSARGRE